MRRPAGFGVIGVGSNNAPTDRLAELTAALATMRVRLARAAEAAGRRSEEIKLLPVTKFFLATDVAILSGDWAAAGSASPVPRRLLPRSPSSTR